DGSHQNVKLTADEYKRVTLWLDLNSNELGADYNVADQQAGKLVWPRIDLNQSNPQGIETNYPLMGDVAVSKHLYRSVKINRNGKIISFDNPDFAMGKVSLYDLSGRCVYSRNFSSDEVRSFAIDLRRSTVAKGTYIVNVEKYNSDQQIEPVKFVIN
ncbi:MAG TPA: T9SS type A sorting domain-containing protein, partial [Chitinispirillaceae bacterium]|nr:T9SS type A sorting domain-containing protein [Chitinispirillaceae bacterium]